MSRNRYRLPEPLEGEVRRELERLGPAAPGSANLVELTGAWSSAVGPTIAANAWPARRTRDGTLVVHVASSAWAQELTQLEATVRDRLGALAPGRLRFVVGPLPETGAESVPSVQHVAGTPTAVEQRQARELVREIENPGLRAAVSRAAALSLARSRTSGPDRPV